MADPLVSIIIPCHNADRWLEECLRSCIDQTHRPIEVIVVDDGSSDRSAEIAAKYEEMGVRLLRQENKGQCAARNIGFAGCKGDYVTFLDADDLLAPEKTKAQVALLERESKDVLATCEWARFYDDPAEAQFVPDAAWKDCDPIEFLTILYRDHLMIHGCCWLAPRQLLERIDPWDESLDRDTDGEYFCRAVLASSAVRFVPNARAYYRSGIPSSMSRKKNERSWAGLWKSTDRCTRLLLQAADTRETRRACANRLQRFAFDAFPAVPRLRAEAQRRVEELGGSDVKPSIGPMLRPVARIAGWQAAFRLRRAVYAMGYEQWGHRRRQRRMRRANG